MALEVEAVTAAEKNNIPEAIQLLNEAIEIAPNRASCYNNRAQALQFSGNVEGILIFLKSTSRLIYDHSRLFSRSSRSEHCTESE